MRSTGNQTWVAGMVAQWFTNHATAAKKDEFCKMNLK